MQRLLPAKLIPSSLWNPLTGSLTLPEMLSKGYVHLVDAYDLRHRALTRDDSPGPTGGISRESQLEFFARRFDGSSARAMLTLLDPNDDLGRVSDRLVSILAGNTVCVTDAPCGASAASLGMLCTLGVLREHGLLPRIPLTIRWLGGELSEHAIGLSAEMFEAVAAELEAQAIFVEREWVPWDVTDPMTNADLVRASDRLAHGVAARLLIVANFNGFLERDRKRNAASAQLEELFRYASGPNSCAVWIEPDQNRTMDRGGFFWWLFSQFRSLWKSLVGPGSDATEDRPAYTSRASFALPLQPDEVSRVKLAVMLIDLARRA